MTMNYRWQFDFEFVKDEKEGDAIVEKLPYEIDSFDLIGDPGGPYLMTSWGEGSISAGGGGTEERHRELEELFPNKTVKSCWRCTEMDQWDDKYGYEDDDYEEDERKEEHVSCPVCGAPKEFIRYVQEMNYYRHIEGIYVHDGHVELGDVERKEVKGNHHYKCVKCSTNHLSIEQITTNRRTPEKLEVRCPKCKASQDKIFYVQEVTQHHKIEEVSSDGHVDLNGVVDAIPHDDFVFLCKDCGHEFDWDHVDGWKGGGPKDG